MTTRRHIFQTHYEDRAFRRCPICLYALDLDHDEARAMHEGLYPEEFDQDFIATAIRKDLDRYPPDNTLPYDGGFELVEEA